jgi:hypothetical protein
MSDYNEEIAKNKLALLAARIEYHEQMAIMLEHKQKEAEKQKVKPVFTAQKVSSNHADSKEAGADFKEAGADFKEAGADFRKTSAFNIAPTKCSAFKDANELMGAKTSNPSNEAADEITALAVVEAVEADDAKAKEIALARDFALAIELSNAEITAARVTPVTPGTPGTTGTTGTSDYLLIASKNTTPNPSPSPSPSRYSPVNNCKEVLVKGSFDVPYNEIVIDDSFKCISDMSVMNKQIRDGWNNEKGKFFILETAEEGVYILVWSTLTPEAEEFQYIKGYYDPRLESHFTGKKLYTDIKDKFTRAISSVYPKLWFDFDQDKNRTVFVLYRSPDSYKKNYEIYKVHTGKSFITEGSVNSFTKWQMEKKIFVEDA